MRRAFLALMLFFTLEPAKSETVKTLSTMIGPHYKVKAPDARATLKTMERLYAIYHPLLSHYIDREPRRMNVWVFDDKESFQTHLRENYSLERDDFVYLETEEERILLAYPKEQASFLVDIAHQGAIQYLMNSQSSLPCWFIEGAALYFETVKWREREGVIHQTPNWEISLALKKRGREERPTIGELLEWNGQGDPHHFLQESWALFSFIIAKPYLVPSRFEDLVGQQTAYDLFVEELILSPFPIER